VKPSEHFLEAAKIVDKHFIFGMYDAICSVATTHAEVTPSNRIDELDEMFKEDALKAGPYVLYWGMNFGLCKLTVDLKEARRCRVLALLFMSEIAKDKE